MPAPPPTPTTSEGVPVVLPRKLTLDDKHARVAKDGFWVGTVALPGGYRAPGRTWVEEGQLADERHWLVRENRRRFRKPTKAERAA